ncbi:MAG: hypothetical protein IGR93_08920 [Hydrococcus sp. C42_A2020_068]|nr:hypothetical protein [Hydrococcus sp. C42_A2020_068]
MLQIVFVGAYDVKVSIVRERKCNQQIVAICQGDSPFQAMAIPDFGLSADPILAFG